MTDQANQLQALVQQSREEQAAITSRILALRSDLDESRPNGGGGGLIQQEPQETAALREQLAELDSALLERDAELDDLRQKVGQMQARLRSSVARPQHAIVWQRKYEGVQVKNELQNKAINDLQTEEGQGEKEINLLSKYIKKLTSQIEEKDRQREGEKEITIKVREHLTSCEKEVKHMDSQVVQLQADFVRCLGRVTRSLAAGILTVSIGGSVPSVAFTIVREQPEGGGIIEFFEEPEAMWELAAMDLGDNSGCTAVVERVHMEITIRSGSNGETLVIYASNNDEYAKWVGTFHLLGLLPKEDVDAALLKQANAGHHIGMVYG